MRPWWRAAYGGPYHPWTFGLSAWYEPSFCCVLNKHRGRRRVKLSMVAMKRGRWRSRCIGGDGDATDVVVVKTIPAMPKRGADKRAGTVSGWMRSRAVAGREIVRKFGSEKNAGTRGGSMTRVTPYESEMMTRSEQVAVTKSVRGTPRGTRAEEKGGRYATWVGGRGEAGTRAVREIWRK